MDVLPNGEDVPWACLGFGQVGVSSVVVVVLLLLLKCGPIVADRRGAVVVGKKTIDVFVCAREFSWSIGSPTVVFSDAHVSFLRLRVTFFVESNR